MRTYALFLSNSKKALTNAAFSNNTIIISVLI